MRLTKKEDALLAALRENAEQDEGGGFWSVYLDNARGTESARSFAGILSSLENKGLYRPSDGEFFGKVKVDAWHDEVEAR